MCGLCGVLAPELNAFHVDIFQGLMAVSTLRGAFGGGIAAVHKTDLPVDILKSAEWTACELAHSADFFTLLGKKEAITCLMGHARFPTSGGTSIADCHPHECNGIIGMHNGTLTHVNRQNVGKKQNDSRMLFEAIAKHGLRPVLQNTRGSYAVSVINRSSDTISFARNEDRPLSFARVEGEDALYWASEIGMLKLVIGRKHKTKKITYFRLNPGVIISFRLHNLGAVEYLNYYSIEPDKKPETEEDNTVYLTLSPNTLDREELLATLIEGCANCKEPATFDDYWRKKTHFFNKTEFMCQECLVNDVLAQTYFTSFGPSLPTGIKTLPQANPARH